MSDTPETDEQINGKPCNRFEVYAGDSLRDAWVASEFARKLERERDRYKSDVEVITRERDEALNKAHNYEQGYLTHAARADTLEKERDEARDNLSQTQKAWIDVCRERTKFAMERDEAREALRILFKDYKELADSGDAGFWELEDKEAAQPALRILQQREAAK